MTQGSSGKIQWFENFSFVFDRFHSGIRSRWGILAADMAVYSVSSIHLFGSTVLY
jgi:hypothetical protein